MDAVMVACCEFQANLPWETDTTPVAKARRRQRKKRFEYEANLCNPATFNQLLHQLDQRYRTGSLTLSPHERLVYHYMLDVARWGAGCYIRCHKLACRDLHNRNPDLGSWTPRRLKYFFQRLMAKKKLIKVIARVDDRGFDALNAYSFFGPGDDNQWKEILAFDREYIDSFGGRRKARTPKHRMHVKGSFNAGFGPGIGTKKRAKNRKLRETFNGEEAHELSTVNGSIGDALRVGYIITSKRSPLISYCKRSTSQDSKAVGGACVADGGCFHREPADLLPALSSHEPQPLCEAPVPQMNESLPSQEVPPPAPEQPVKPPLAQASVDQPPAGGGQPMGKNGGLSRRQDAAPQESMCPSSRRSSPQRPVEHFELGPGLGYRTKKRFEPPPKQILPGDPWYESESDRLVRLAIDGYD